MPRKKKKQAEPRRSPCCDAPIGWRVIVDDGEETLEHFTCDACGQVYATCRMTAIPGPAADPATPPELS